MIGRGAFGTVYRAVHPVIGKAVAIELSAPSTTLRKVSTAAVIGGAGALVASGVLVGLAFPKQSRALELAGSSERARDYNAALKARNDWRLAAAVTAGVEAIATSAGIYGLLSEGFGPTIDASAGSTDAGSLPSESLSAQLFSLRSSF